LNKTFRQKKGMKIIPFKCCEKN